MQRPSKSSLPSSRVKLLELMQRLNFGTIKGLIVRDSEPILNPHPRVIRDVKLGTKNGPRPEASLDDFFLKDEVIELFAQFDSFEGEILLSLEIKHGLPFRIQWEVVAA